MAPFLRGLDDRGFDADYVSLPRGTTERALPAYRAALDAAPSSVIGGQSFGGRVASLIAAEEPVVGLVLLCYPLHPPGRSERWSERSDHWPAIECPVLLLSGDRDPFAKVDLLTTAVRRLPDAELHVYPGIGHGLRAVREDVIERIAHYLQGLALHSGQ